MWICAERWLYHTYAHRPTCRTRTHKYRNEGNSFKLKFIVDEADNKINQCSFFRQRVRRQVDAIHETVSKKMSNSANFYS
jgi:hypothetical protein